MKQRIWSALLAFAMLLTLFPVSALAVDSEYSANTEVMAAPPENPTADTGNELDDSVPEFVPGLIPETCEFIYPDYDPYSSSFFAALPSAYDGRDKQSSVKNQGSNGLCWAFGTYAAVEANCKKATGQELDLSELHMGYALSDKNKDGSPNGNSQGFPRFANEGGNRIFSSAYLMRGTDLSGAVSEADDPYIRTVLEDRDLSITASKDKSYQVQNILFLTGDAKPSDDEIVTIKNLIQSNGGVGASMYWDGQTTATDGVDTQPYYNTATHSYFYNGHSNYINHLVEIAGWDDNYPATNFNAAHRPDGNGAWLVKNSWGSNWGDDGYCWISYEDTKFPIETFCIDGVELYDNSLTVYEKDYTAMGDYISFSSSCGYFARAYAANTTGETLQSVRVMVSQPSTIDVDCVPLNTLLSKTYTFSSRGQTSAPYPGWYTVDLDNPIGLGNANEKFAVVVKITTDENHKAGICYDIFHDDQTSTADVYNGGSDGTSWNTQDARNYCIKAVTKPADTSKAIADKAAAKLTWDMIRGENTDTADVWADLTLPTTGNYGTAISWSSNSDVIGTNGKVSAKTSKTQVTLTATVTSGTKSTEKTFSLTVPAVSGDVISTANLITWDSIKGSNTDQNAVTSALALTASTENVTITWTSSNTDIITADGTVTQPRFDKKNDVTLSAVVTDSTGAKKQVTFDLHVTNRAATVEDKYDVAVEWLNADLINRWWPLIKGKNTSPSQIRYNLEIPNGITVNLEGLEPYTIETLNSAYAQSKEDNLSGNFFGKWEHVDQYGTVTRPKYGQNNSVGVFSISLLSGANNSYRGYSGTWLTVLAYRGEIAVTVNDAAVTQGNITEKLSADTSGTKGNPGTLSYQWYQCDDTDKTNPTAIPGAASADFSIPTDLQAGTYYYYCAVSALDAATAKSNVAAVTVTGASTELKPLTADMISLDSTKLTYDGSEQKPAVTVTYSDGTELKENIDYTVAYSDNIDAGTATVTITGKGSYTGTNTATFTIVPAALTTARNASINMQAGTEITIEAVSFGLTVDGTFDLQEGEKITGTGLDGDPDYGESITLKLADDAAAGTITIPVTFTPESDNYKPVDLTLTVNVADEDTIITEVKVTPFIKTYDGEAVTQDELEENLTVTEGVEGTWSTEDTLPTTAGVYAITMTFTPTTENCTPATVNISITINKADPDVTTPTGLEIISGQALSTIMLPEGWAWDDPEETVAETGSFPATYTPSDTTNFHTVAWNLTVTVIGVTPPTHAHNWAETWAYDTTHHWHNCLEDGCTVLENSLKPGYDPHTYDDDGADTPCSICGYIRAEIPPTAGFTITFKTADGSIPGGITEGTTMYLQITTDADGRIASLPAATRSGYTFNGWFTEEIGGSLITTSTVFTEDTSVYAQWSKNPSSGSSSSSSSESTTTAPSVTVPVSGDQSTIQVSASVSGSTATVNKISATQINDVIGDDVRTGIVEIDFTGLDKDVDSVKLPMDSISEIADAAQERDNDVKGLTIKMSTGEITFDGDALTAIQEQAGKQITVTIAPTDRKELNDRQRAMVGDAPIFDLTIQSGGKTITDFKGGYATIALPYTLKRGENPSGIVVYYLDSTGNIHPCETMYDVRTETAIFTTSHLSLYFVGYDQAVVLAEVFENPFTDVQPGAYYYDAVQWAVKQGITSGTNPTSFSPDASCTRVQMVTFLWRAAGSPAPRGGSNPFTDVQPGTYYYDAVQWAVEQGITSGTSAARFSPEAAVTRGQTVSFLYRAAGSPAVSGNLPFPDVADDAYYASAVQWAVAEGITSGTSATAFSPDRNCTRSQIVTFLYNAKAN